MLLFCNINADAGFELDREMVGKDGDFLDEAFDLILVKVRDIGFLLADEVLQLLDMVEGFFPLWLSTSDFSFCSRSGKISSAMAS